MIDLTLADEAATARLAAGLAAQARPGDVLALDGPLGIGKSAFARAFIRALTGPETEVPSPTFNLVLTYDTPRGELWHVDLYRLDGPADTVELGLEEAFEHTITLLEWPDRLGSGLPRHALTVSFSDGPSADSRRVRLRGGAGWAARLAPLAASPL